MCAIHAVRPFASPKACRDHDGLEKACNRPHNSQTGLHAICVGSFKSHLSMLLPNEAYCSRPLWPCSGRTAFGAPQTHYALCPDTFKRAVEGNTKTHVITICIRYCDCKALATFGGPGTRVLQLTACFLLPPPMYQATLPSATRLLLFWCGWISVIWLVEMDEGHHPRSPCNHAMLRSCLSPSLWLQCSRQACSDAR